MRRPWLPGLPQSDDARFRLTLIFTGGNKPGTTPRAACLQRVERFADCVLHNYDKAELIDEIWSTDDREKRAKAISTKQNNRCRMLKSPDTIRSLLSVLSPI